MPLPHTRTRLNSANYSDSSPTSSLESTELNWAQCGSSLGPGQSLEHSQSVDEDGRCPAANSCSLPHPRDVVEGSYTLYYPERSYSSSQTMAAPSYSSSHTMAAPSYSSSQTMAAPSYSSSHTMAAPSYTYSHTNLNQQNNFQNYQISFQSQQNNIQNYPNDFQNYKNTFQKPENEVQKQNLNGCTNIGSNGKGGSHGRTAIQNFSEIGGNTQFEMDSMVPYFEKRGYPTGTPHGYHDQTVHSHVNTEHGYQARPQLSQLDEEHRHHDQTVHSNHGHQNQTVLSHHGHQNQNHHSDHGQLDQAVHSHHGQQNQNHHSDHGQLDQTVLSHQGQQNQNHHSHQGHLDQTVLSHQGQQNQNHHSHVDTERGYNNRTLRSQMLYLATKLDSSLKITEQKVFNKPSEDNQIENCEVFELPSTVQVFELPLFSPPLIQNFGNSVKCWNENRVLKIKIAAIRKDSI